MSDGLLELVPSARVGHIGVFRDPATHKPVEYLVRLPDTAERIFILCDPMVATGNSAVYAIDVLKQRGDSIGTFQVESRAQQSMLPRLRPACFYDQ